jgi:CheY-like chemotaxis protein
MAVQSACGAPDVAGLDDPDENSRTVLLVEDESMVRSIFRRILQENGYFVLEAATGAEALFLAEQFSYPIDLLVTDIAMPKMNGLELSRKLAALHPETRTLFLSGYLEGALPGGKAPDKGSAFLQKPFKTHTLVQKVREVMEAARSD